MTNEFKFFQKKQQMVEGELNPDFEIGVVGKPRFLWKWCDSEEGVPTYNPNDFSLTYKDYELIHMTWSDFMIMTQGKMVFIRYIITPIPNNRIIVDLLPNQWDIDLNNDMLLIKCAIW